MIQHKKAFGIYHWDTFDNETLFLHEVDTLVESDIWVRGRYKDRIRADGADQVDVVNLSGDIVRRYSVA